MRTPFSLLVLFALVAAAQAVGRRRPHPPCLPTTGSGRTSNRW